MLILKHLELIEMINYINQYVLVAVVLVLITFSSCTKNFEEINTNTIGITDQQGQADGTLQILQLQQAQRAIVNVINSADVYQVSQNLNADVFSGYMASPTNFNANQNNLTYALQVGWNRAAWERAYREIMNPLYRVETTIRGNETLNSIYAMSKILKVEAMHRISDLYGPIIYSQYNIANSDGGVEYESQEQAYNNFFADLDTARNLLIPLLNQPASTIFSRADLVYSGNINNWLKFANTLRLRLALRISNVNPTLARLQGESALNTANGGVIENNTESFIINLQTDNPLNTINNSWHDIGMSAVMESFLTGYQDSRIASYFQPATDPLVLGQFKGIRQGINIDAKARYENYSRLAPMGMTAQLLKAPEAWFLKAEAALKNWANAGSVQMNYETGIRRSFEQYNLSASVAEYIVDNTKRPAPYIDPKSATTTGVAAPGANDVLEGSPYLSTITIRWEEAASTTDKMERIITQKWISMYPDGAEAWAEQRRTGFPKLFPIVVNYSNGVIPSVPGIRRLPFSDIEYNNNRAAVTQAVSSLSGPDNGATRLWWDVL
ncbi:SusD/RagB family nutrient-binding outer membrane lipoprotein [Pedobacter sp. AW1-32]|uniref:SusD/RagB family nutrient-binding outer membrane lipoprotein n=1 Tax=Pedobacter sp. AW1-32 TaxID=3383026 RepID=UPI003FEE917C